MGRKRIRCLLGRECCSGRWGGVRADGLVKVYQLEDPKEEVTVLVGVGPGKEAGHSKKASFRSKSFLERRTWTKLDPFGAEIALYQPTPPGNISSAN